jgi:hypothetical protein
MGQFVLRTIFVGGLQWDTLFHLSDLAAPGARSYRESLGLSVPSAGALKEQVSPHCVVLLDRPSPPLQLEVHAGEP